LEKSPDDEAADLSVVARTPDWLGSAAVLEQIPDGVIVADADGRIVLVNEAAARLHGTKRLGVGLDGYSQAYGLFTLDGRPFPPDELPLARAVAGETVTDARWAIRRPDGREVVAIGTARPLLDDAGRPRGAILTLRDDSARHRAELAVAESEARFRTIADCAPAPVWVTGPEGIEFVNRAYVEIAERPAAELLGHAWIGHFHEEDIAHILALRDEAWRTGTPYEWEARFQRAGGQWVWVRATCAPRFDAEGGVLGYVGMAVDTTESRRAEAELRSSEALLRAMFDNAGVGMVLMDRDCIIAEANAAFAGITGRSEEELPGSDCLGLTHPDDAPAQRALLDALAAGGGPAAFEKRYLHKDGRTIWVRITLSMIGEQVLAVVEDVTARKTAELHLRLMVDELNHRVKNTLAIVQGLAQQSFSGTSVPGEVMRSFEGRLAALAAAHNLLTRANWESAELRDLAHEVLGVHSPGRFTIEGPPVRLEPKTAVSLAMALHELCTNAIKYGALSQDGGHVAIRWELREPARLALRWEESGGPPVAAPGRRGFGTRMIERALAGEIGGGARLIFAREGVVCEIDARRAGSGDEQQEQARHELGGQEGAGGRGRADRGHVAGGHAA
jgi:PAS domain S-box-containing protein